MCPSVNKQLWGGQLWSDGYFVTTVGKHVDEDIIRNYAKNQADDLHKDQFKKDQLFLW